MTTSTGTRRHWLDGSGVLLVTHARLGDQPFVERGLDVGDLASTFTAMNKDQKEGLAQNIKGRVKEATGVLTGDKDKESDGATERAKGAVKKAVGDVKHGIAKKLDK